MFFICVDFLAQYFQRLIHDMFAVLLLIVLQQNKQKNKEFNSLGSCTLQVQFCSISTLKRNSTWYPYPLNWLHPAHLSCLTPSFTHSFLSLARSLTPATEMATPKWETEGPKVDITDGIQSLLFLWRNLKCRRLTSQTSLIAKLHITSAAEAQLAFFRGHVVAAIHSYYCVYK